MQVISITKGTNEKEQAAVRKREINSDRCDSSKGKIQPAAADCVHNFSALPALSNLKYPISLDLSFNVFYLLTRLYKTYNGQTFKVIFS